MSPAEAKQETIKLILHNLEQELMDNKSGLAVDSEFDDNNSKVSKAKILREMTDEDREFVENIDDEYYKRVRSSDEFYRRKKLILMNLDKLEAKVSHLASNFDEY